MATVTCPVCGSKVNAQTSYCPKCGADPRLDAEEARSDLVARDISVPLAPVLPARRTVAQRRRLYILASVVLVAVLAGVAWRAVTAPHYYSTSRSLAVVAFPDLSHAWVAGDYWTNGDTGIAGGVIESTTSGGTRWTLQTSSAQWSDPTSVAFANARCGWLLESWNATMQPNVLLATTDGGVAWRTQGLPTQASIFGIACVGTSHAWAVGWEGDNGGIILATTDGGAHWKRQALTSHGNLEEVAFADAEHGWAVGDGVIVATIDGGTDWKQQGPVTNYYLSDVACADTRHAWAVGTSPSNRDVILATMDGGTTWRVQYIGSGQNSKGQVGYSAVAFADALHGWVVGLGGTILATTDGGRTWKPQQSGTTVLLHDVAFANARDGLVVGDYIEGDDPLAGKLDGSVILHTTNGGATWLQ